MKQIMKATTVNGKLTVIIEYNSEEDKYYFYIINRTIDGVKHLIDKFDSLTEAWQEATVAMF